jgi:hypothetical protein
MKTQGVGTRDWGLGAKLSVASCVRASSPRGIGGLGSSNLSAAGYYKRNNICNNIHTTYKIKHTPFLQNKAVRSFRINEFFPRKAHN